MAYTVKSGDTLSSIAAAHGISVDELVRLNGLITVGQVLKLVAAPVTPPVVVPPVVVPPKPAPIGGTVKFYELGPSGTVAANKVLQTALNKEFGGVVVDGDYGPQTMAAYVRWQTKVGSTAQPWDGLPGKVSLPPLAAKYGFKVDYSAPPAPAAGAEPAQNYTRTTYGGRTVNQRTKDMLAQAAAIYGGSFTLSQGSYNVGVAASAGTHDGGGVVDVASTDTKLLKALRQVGFAAWIRSPAEGFAYHTHCCAIGDREMSGIAKDQITSYFNGRNGLADNGRDTAPSSVGRPYPAWAKKYGAPI